MNWEAVGAVGAVIGGIAVVATLVYLGAQIKQNNALLREQARYQMLQNQVSFNDGLARDPDLVSIIFRIPRDDQKEIREARAQTAAFSLLLRWQWEYQRSKVGILGGGDLPAESMKRHFELFHLADYWSNVKDDFEPEFVEFLDREVAGEAT